MVSTQYNFSNEWSMRTCDKAPQGLRRRGPYPEQRCEVTKRVEHRHGHIQTPPNEMDLQHLPEVWSPTRITKKDTAHGPRLPPTSSSLQQNRSAYTHHYDWPQTASLKQSTVKLDKPGLLPQTCARNHPPNHKLTILYTPVLQQKLWIRQSYGTRMTR